MAKLFTNMKKKKYSRCVLNCKMTTHMFYVIKLSGATSRVRCLKGEKNNLSRINSVLVTRELKPIPRWLEQRRFLKGWFFAFQPPDADGSPRGFYCIQSPWKLQIMLKNKVYLEEKASDNKVRYPSSNTSLILIRQYVPAFSYYIK
jgi:hypothetical protein